MSPGPSRQWTAAIRATNERLERLVLRTGGSGTPATGRHAIPLSGRAERGMVLLG